MKPKYITPRLMLWIAMIGLMSILFLARLGHYTLWDDEALTALSAKAVLQTGDTSMKLDHDNIVAYRGGMVIHNGADRSTPPLPIYQTALAFFLFGISSGIARLPFALMGLAACGLIFYGARHLPIERFVALAIALTTNVSLILYCRQCRYYGGAIFFTVAVLFFYHQAKASPRILLGLAFASAGLFATNYLSYLSLYAALGIDYLVWKRYTWRPSFSRCLWLFGPQLLLNGAIAFIWNPLKTPFASYEASNSFGERLLLLSWFWRDLDQAEGLCLPLLFLALAIGIYQKQIWLTRGCLAIFIYLLVITFIAPQPVKLTSVADIRYAVPLIPLALVLETGALCLLLRRHPGWLIVVAILAFGTNLLHFQSFYKNGPRATLLNYVGELIQPVPEPYTPTATWINDHVAEGASVWVLPDYATYPLMFAAPRALYAWQLPSPPRPDLAGLPAIHFQGRELPDYVVTFGPAQGQLNDFFQQLWQGPPAQYERVAVIDTFWRDLYRPELFWRTFTPITGYNRDLDAIYVFRRVVPPLAAPVRATK